MFHNNRNIFEDKELYITKRKLELVQLKHPQESKYINNNEFQIILDNTIANCGYSKDNDILNFISYFDNKYILYGISNNSYYIYLTTIFYPSKKQLNNCKNTINFFNLNAKEIFEDYLK